MNPRNTPLTLEEKETIRRVYLEVGNQHKVAIITGHSNTTVGKVLKDYGLNKKQGGNQVAQMKITDEQLVEAVQKMTTKQIAEKYSIHETNVLRRCKKLGIKPVASPKNMVGLNKNIEGLKQSWGKYNENLKAAPNFGECWHYVSSFAVKCNELHPGFVYLETRRTKSSNAKRVRLKCKVCNTVIERAESTVRQKNIECDCCKRNQQLQDERVKLMRFFIALKDSKTPKECKYCGKEFYSKYPNSQYCSSRCKSKAKGGSLKARCKKYGAFYDPSVTPAKIFARDHYVCQICGQPCVKDTTWTEYFGPKSPTVDHIVALANGGDHVWGNVQCAHAICNSYKRDLLIV